MLALHRTTLIVCALALAALFALFASFGVAKPVETWHWVDIMGEGGTAALSAVWLLFLLGGRPRGRVTTLLACGLAAIMLAFWADCLDEFYRVDKLTLWDNAVEGALMPIGVLLLTVGLFHWRDEQRALSQQLSKRERLFREHRAFDPVTQLADAGYLAQQIRLEQARLPQARCAVLLFDIDRFHVVNRVHGQREGDRLLQAVSHLLLLNLRHDDLLCRYAGDRFAVLMPDTNATQAQRTTLQLARSIESLRHHPRHGDRALQLSVRNIWAMAEGDVDQLLRSLNRAIDEETPTAAPQFA